MRSEACHTEADRNNKGTGRKYEVGDQVSFFIPPSENEAKQMGRKPKHLPQYRGPAIIAKVLTNTTYELMFQGRAYFRCFSELRAYRSNRLPMNLPAAQDIEMQKRDLVVGNYVALCDSDRVEDDHFHLCKVLSIKDGKTVLLNYATWQTKIKRAKWSIMYQHKSDLAFTTTPSRKNPIQQEVIDWVTVEEADGYIDHYDVKLTKSMRITTKCIKHLKQLGLKHHALGKTFPHPMGGLV